MKRIIHVNQNVIKNNAKAGMENPPITVKESGGRNRYCRDIEILGPSKIVYRPHDKLKCGASVWIETSAEVNLFEETNFSELCSVSQAN